MRTDSWSRIVAAGIMGIALGGLLHHEYTKWHERGREAFLAFHAHRFDHYFSGEHSIVGSLLAGCVLMGLVLGLYELIARLCRWALLETTSRPSDVQKPTTPP